MIFSIKTQQASDNPAALVHALSLISTSAIRYETIILDVMASRILRQRSKQGALPPFIFPLFPFLPLPILSLFR